MISLSVQLFNTPPKYWAQGKNQSVHSLKMSAYLKNIQYVNLLEGMGISFEKKITKQRFP